jgi:hypothetical protein
MKDQGVIAHHFHYFFPLFHGPALLEKKLNGMTEQQSRRAAWSFVGKANCLSTFVGAVLRASATSSVI